MWLTRFRSEDVGKGLPGTRERMGVIVAEILAFISAGFYHDSDQMSIRGNARVRLRFRGISGSRGKQAGFPVLKRDCRPLRGLGGWFCPISLRGRQPVETESPNSVKPPQGAAENEQYPVQGPLTRGFPPDNGCRSAIPPTRNGAAGPKSATEIHPHPLGPLRLLLLMRAR